jgi:hypothetical protein
MIGHALGVALEAASKDDGAAAETQPVSERPIAKHNLAL